VSVVGRLRAVPGSLQARVTAAATLAVVAVLTLAGVALVLAQRSALLETLDETLAQQAAVVVADLRAGGSVERADLLSDDVAVQITGGGRSVTVGALPDDEDVRLLTRQVDGRTVRVVGDLDDVAESTATLVRGLAAGVPLAAAVLAGVVWWAVGRALRPVEDLRTQVESISASRLAERVPEPAAPREMARLAHTMNAMLARLQRSAEQQRAFVADASHELRSPLARMRAELEVDRAHPEAADPAATSASVLAETIELQRLVDDLLLLARGDAGALRPDRGHPVDLDDVVREQAGRRRGSGPDLDISGVQPVQVIGDPAQLARAVANLLDNAVRHAARRVTLTLGEQPPGTAVLTVADDGPGIPPAERERVFERFTRLDEARTAAHGGAGLGLAIAREIAARHGGTLALEPDAGGARFVLRLPVAAG
jgi:signal transduction histidine kinase